MDPLTNLQVAIKNNVDVFYFSCVVPYNVLFAEDGQMGKLAGSCFSLSPSRSRARVRGER